MEEDITELETRPAEPERNEKPDLAPTRKNDDQPQQKVGTSKDRQAQEGDRLPAPLPRWPFVLVGLVVAICVAGVLYIIFRPRPDVRTDDGYVMVHYATIAPRISGQVATVAVDDNDIVKTGQVLATLDPRDNETALAFLRGGGRTRQSATRPDLRYRVSPAVDHSGATGRRCVGARQARFRAGRCAPLRQPRHDGSRHNAGTSAGRQYASAGSSLAGQR